MTITESKILAQVGNTLYESPDGGKTIYARERGSSTRTLLTKDDALFVQSIEVGKWQNRIKDIVELSRTVPALKDQLEKLNEIYLLVKNENDQ